MTNDGLEPAGGAPERFASVLQRDIAKWQQVATVAGIKAGH
jgi:tripartite-type tricarboxylate transporter receptor subunit TctC